jgi:hypothetical protein
MRLTDAENLLVGDRVLMEWRTQDFMASTILEISPSRRFYRLQYYAFGREQYDWFGVSILKERLPALKPKKGWFS